MSVKKEHFGGDAALLTHSGGLYPGAYSTKANTVIKMIKWNHAHTVNIFKPTAIIFFSKLEAVMTVTTVSSLRHLLHPGVVVGAQGR